MNDAALERRIEPLEAVAELYLLYDSPVSPLAALMDATATTRGVALLLGVEPTPDRTAAWRPHIVRGIWRELDRRAGIDHYTIKENRMEIIDYFPNGAEVMAVYEDGGEERVIVCHDADTAAEKAEALRRRLVEREEAPRLS